MMTHDDKVRIGHSDEINHDRSYYMWGGNQPKKAIGYAKPPLKTTKAANKVKFLIDDNLAKLERRVNEFIGAKNVTLASIQLSINNNIPHCYIVTLTYEEVE